MAIGFGNTSSSGNESTGGSNFIADDGLIIFKRDGNTDIALLEVNDFVLGIVETAYIGAVYLGGNKTLLASYDIKNQIDF